MPNKKNPRHIRPTLICLVLVLGLTTNGCNIIAAFWGIGGEDETQVCTAGSSITCTDTTGENIEELPVPGGVELNFVTPPAFPITFLVVRVPALT